MKSCLCFLIFFLFSCVCQATPGGSSKTKEKFIGSNETGFAVLRTTREIKGSHYEQFYKRYLDVYVKEVHETEDGPHGMKLESSTLITDITKDTTHYPKVGTTVNFQNTELKYSEVLVKFHQELHLVEPTLITLIKEDKDAVISGLIRERLGYGPDVTKKNWKIVEVMRDPNCIYLKVKLGDNNKYICILPDEVKLLKK